MTIFEEVRLSVPAESAYAFAPRVVAAWLVAAAGEPIDTVEDARLAVDEVVGAFLAADRPVDAVFLAAENITVDVAGSAGSGEVRLTPMAERILSVVASGCTPLTDGRDGYRIVLRQSRPGGEPAEA